MVIFDTVFPADSLEFCPTIGYQDIFVCGTYNLLEHPPSQSESGEVGKSTAQNRRGQCLVFRTNFREDCLLCGHSRFTAWFPYYFLGVKYNPLIYLQF
jgi:diphthamide biosynthesis protein 7